MVEREATTASDVGQAAAELLAQDKVDVVIGHGRANGNAHARPVFARTAEQAEALVFDTGCVSNLAVYLPKQEVQDLGRVGIVVKGCDMRAVTVLLREHVIERDAVALIGVRCGGVGDPQLDKCAACDVHEPEGCDVVVGEPVGASEAAAPEARYQKVAEMEQKSLEERWAYWQGQLSKCIRCYACRQACPLCYCKQCLMEKSSPQWIETSAHLRGNLAWNMARALHLAGRCVGCGECERVCPMGLPLGLINEKLAQLMDEWYDFRSGQSPDEKAPFSNFSQDDPEPGIL